MQSYTALQPSRARDAGGRTWILRVANSTPIVDLLSRLNSFRVNRLSRFDLPTPESPIRTTLKR